METLIYLGKVNLYWILFYACYWLVFRNHTFFKWNRAYLLGSLILAFLVPLIEFSDRIPVTSTAVYAVSAIPVYVSSPQTTSYFSHWVQFVWVVQLVGACIMFSKLTESVKDLIVLLKQGDSIEFSDYTLILLPHNEIGSFSFLKWLVINNVDYDQHFDPILRHESVHIKQYHSLDVLFIELLKIVFWFNPVLWFYKQSVQEVHEFLADDEVPNRDYYARFLISYTLAAPVASLTNHFFNSSLLKTRIQMLYKNRNSHWTLGKYLMVIPVIGIVLMLTAARERLLTAVEKASFNAISGKNISIEGTVRDEDGKVVKAATIIVKGATKGTATDENGRFKLNDVSLGSTLIITHINYETFEIEVNGVTVLDFITLRKKDNTLAEVFITPNAGKNNLAVTSETQEGKFKVIEKNPQFPGGNQELSNFLSKTILYPSQALKEGIQGQVIVSFIVNEQGYIRNPKIEKGIGSGLDEEALRVVLKMPRWEPGIQGGEPIAVQYNLPITFQAKSEENKRQGQLIQATKPSAYPSINQAPDMTIGRDIAVGAGAENYGTIKRTVPATTFESGSNTTTRSKIVIKGLDSPLSLVNPPLYILDGKIMEDKDFLKTVNPDTIQSISVLKGQGAMTQYGFKARNGVILIETKKK